MLIFDVHSGRICSGTRVTRQQECACCEGLAGYQRVHFALLSSLKHISIQMHEYSDRQTTLTYSIVKAYKIIRKITMRMHYFYVYFFGPFGPIF